MMKRFFCILLVILCVLGLSACACKHEQWTQANCDTAKTCQACGETEGAPLGHSWLAADCEKSKTCETCGKTEGEPLGHDWEEANCLTAKTCTRCHKVEGEALGHEWQDATTEAPKTCSRCAATEGERIITDERFTTASTIDLHGTWYCEIETDGEMMELPGFEGAFLCRYEVNFSNDGKMKMSISIVDKEAFDKNMLTYLIETTYAEFEIYGMNRDEADAALMQNQGMTVPEYCQIALESIDITALFDALDVSYVYYVEDGVIYTGMSWRSEMDATEFTLEEGKLVLFDDVTGGDAEKTVLTPVEP